MKRYISLIVLSVALTGLTSCLKDKATVQLDGSQTPPTVAFRTQDDVPGKEFAGYTLFNRGYDIKPSIAGTFEVVYDGITPAPNDVTVTLEVDPAVLTAYNDAVLADDPDADTYTAMPTNLYTLQTSVVIKAGTRVADVATTYKTASFDLNEKYALPLRIKSVTSGKVSSNFGTVIYAVAAKNQYDGSYHSLGVFHHPTAGDRNIDRDKTLSTTGPNSVSTEIGDVGGAMNLIIDAATNNVTIDGQLSPTQPLIPVPGKTNTYDPATKSFTLNYEYLGGGGYRVIEEVIKLK